MTDESWQTVVDSLRGMKGTELARQTQRTARAECQLAQANLRAAQADERYHELEFIAMCHAGNGELFSPFGDITARERAIVLATARYIVLGQTNTEWKPSAT